MNNWQEGFPQAYRDHPRFAELVELVERIANHPAMHVATETVRRNMIQASLVFTVCFYGHLWSAFQFVFGSRERRGPFGVQQDLSLLHLLFELARDELTDKLPGRDYRGPHYAMLLDGAKQAGIRTEPVEKLAYYFTGPYVISQGCEDILDATTLCQELKNYLDYSHLAATRIFESAMVTLALRELTLAPNFRVIRDHMPDNEKYRATREFFVRHVELDENTHRPLMTRFLEIYLSGEAYVPWALDIMIRFYTLRLAVYDRCLQRKPLY